jgi:hypothetical protein
MRRREALDNRYRLDNRYSYVIAAPKEYQGGEFVSWQSEKTGMIIPDPTLRLIGASSQTPGGRTTG